MFDWTSIGEFIAKVGVPTAIAFFLMAELRGHRREMSGTREQLAVLNERLMRVVKAVESRSTLLIGRPHRRKPPPKPKVTPNGERKPA